MCQFAAAALGLLELSLGHAAEAAEWLRSPVELARTEGIDEPGLTRYVPDCVEALVELDRLEEAAELLGWYQGNAERLGRQGAIAASHRCRGLLAAAEGRLDDALAAFEQALVEHEAVPLPFDRARTLLVYGAALRRSKRKADARDRLEQAAAAFEELSASAFLDRANAELARIAGRRRSEGGLTPTERQIAELVAEGRSNKEVAAALFVSVKTVEANLSRVYAKLGLRGRGELARHVIEGEDGSETVGVSPISIGSWPAYRRGMERKPQTEGEGSMYKRILRKRILKGLVISLALFAVIPISNAAAKPVSVGQPIPGSRRCWRTSGTSRTRSASAAPSSPQ